MSHQNAFAVGELLLHHRYEQGVPITCGAAHGCITAVVDDVRCPKCREVLAAFPEDPQECDHGRWNPDNGQCLDCGHLNPKDLPRAVHVDHDADEPNAAGLIKADEGPE